jgi:hypothetical protein
MVRIKAGVRKTCWKLLLPSREGVTVAYTKVLAEKLKVSEDKKYLEGIFSSLWQLIEHRT